VRTGAAIAQAEKAIDLPWMRRGASRTSDRSLLERRNGPMRLWTLHPKYLDRQGLLALWREALLARAVLRGKTSGYRHHPQLERFRSHPTPRRAICAYLEGIQAEAESRGYRFDRRKVGAVRRVDPIPATEGQVSYEWGHLMRKLSARSPLLCRRWRAIRTPECHPLFRVAPGGIEPWEGGKSRQVAVAARPQGGPAGGRPERDHGRVLGQVH
jgi:hypothetical protein